MPNETKFTFIAIYFVLPKRELALEPTIVV